MKPSVTIGRYQDRIPSDRPIQQLIDVHGKGAVYINGVTCAEHESKGTLDDLVAQLTLSEEDYANEQLKTVARAEVAELVDAAARRVNNKESHSEDEAVALVASLPPETATLLGDEVNQPAMLAAIQARMVAIVPPDATNAQAEALATGSGAEGQV